MTNLNDTIKNYISKFDFRLFKKICFLTFVIGFFTHGFAFANDFFSHDSIRYFNQLESEINVKNAIGRFFHSGYINLRGSITVPWLLGCISLFWISLTNYFVVKTLNLKHIFSVIVVCGLLTANLSFVLLVATYMHEVDTYMLALLCSVLAVYVFEKNRKISFFLSPLLIFFMSGLYQSYLSVTILMFMLLIYKDIMENKEFKKNFFKGLQAIFVIFLGLVLYQVVLKVSGPALTDGSRITGAFKFLEGNVFDNLYNTYDYFYDNFLSTITYNSDLVRNVIIIIIVISVFVFISKVFKNKVSFINIVLVGFLFLLIPFACSIIYFLSAGSEMHHLMITSFSLVYLFTICLVDTDEYVDLLSLKSLLFFLISITIFNQIVFANSLYLEKELIADSMNLTMNRVVYDIEKSDGYKIGQTDVMFIGGVRHSNVHRLRPGFEFLSGTGTNDISTILFYHHYSDYFNEILGYTINVVYPNQYLESEEKRVIIESMPSFPTEGYVSVIDGKIVVKFADVYSFY